MRYTSRLRASASCALALTVALASCRDTPGTGPTTFVSSKQLTTIAEAQSIETIGDAVGSTRFERRTGQPVTERLVVAPKDSFAFDAPFEVLLENGTDNGTRRVTSGEVWIDEVLVFSAEDIRGDVGHLRKAVTLRPRAVIAIRLDGAPGAFVTIRIRGRLVAARAEIGREGGSLAFPQAATIQFSPGAFRQRTNVEVSLSTEPEPLAKFAEFQSLFRVSSKIGYVVRVLATAPLSSGGTFRATLVVPASLTIPTGDRPELFVQEHQTGGEETLDNFELYPSVWDPAVRGLTADLPARLFTSARRTDGKYEALIMVGATPGFGSSESSIEVSGRASGAASTCLAAPIADPVVPASVTSPFGVRTDPTTGLPTMHWGADLRAPTGTLVLAAEDGVIETATVNSGGLAVGYGRYLVLRHDDGSATLYGHLLSTSGVHVGQKVARGDPIAVTDNTGKTTGPHLHLEYVPNGSIVRSKQRIDPEPCLAAPVGSPQTIFSTFGPGDSYDGSTYYPITAADPPQNQVAQWVAASFVYTGVSDRPLSRVRLAGFQGPLVSIPVGPLRVALLRGTDVATASELEAWSLQSTIGVPQLHSLMSSTNVNLIVGETYWLFVRPELPNTSWGGWYVTNTAAQTPVFLSHDGGATWRLDPFDPPPAFDISVR